MLSQEQSIYEHIAKTARQYPEHVLIVEGEVRWTAAAFLEKVDQLAYWLAQKGFQPGDRVALMMLNQKEFLVSFVALLKQALVPVPINLQLPPEDIFFVLQHSGSKLVMTTALFAPHFQGKPIPVLVANQEPSAEAASEQPAWEAAVASASLAEAQKQSPVAKELTQLTALIYTSGTTGRPKGVMLSEHNLLSNIIGFTPVLHFDSTDRILLALPLFHAYGLIIGLYALMIPGQIVLEPRFAPKKLLQALIQEQVTVLPLVPTMFRMLAEQAERIGTQAFSHLRLCVSGGASLPAKLLKHVEAVLDVIVLEGYGLTETAPVLCVNNPERGSIPGSVGKALPNIALRLRDEQGNWLPWAPGETSAEGEICVQGPNVMLGYYQAPTETAAVLNDEGWFATGDLGHLDPEGNVFISGGRKKDLIIKAGENIAPIRVEQVLYQHPAIAEASVIGVPDDKVGEEILACIQLKPDSVPVNAQELKQFCRMHLPPFMVPEAFRFYEELPKNQAGKILKNVLRQDNPALVRA